MAAKNAQLQSELAAREASAAGSATAGGEALEALQQDLDQLRQDNSRIEKKLQHVVSERDSLKECLDEAIAKSAAGQTDDRHLQAVAAERDRLADELDAMTQKLAEAELRGAASPESKQLSKKYEMAMDDLREAKRRIAELQRGGKTEVRGGGGDALDWEAQKKRMLEALEADEEGESAEQAADRLKMQEVVRRTEAVVAAKNDEIEELRHTLEQQSSSLGGMAVGAAALGELLGQDEIIKHERERIAQIKGEWEEKLRNAEVELSVQRAQVARDRAKLEELQRNADHHATEKGADGKTKKGQKGWRAMMGLNENG
jgi:hypothetical protein